MKEILRKLEAIAAGNKKEKRKLMLEYMLDPDFSKFMIYCLDESKTFNVTRVAMKNSVEGEFYTHTNFYDKLDELNIKGSATKADKEELAALGSQSPEHLEVLNKILRKNPDCGFSAKSMHAILPGVIPYYPYQRCSTDKELDRIFKDNNLAFSELKADGMFIRTIVTPKGVTYQTRNGKTLDFLGVPDRYFLDYIREDAVAVEGEAVVLNKQLTALLPRAESNAIVTKFMGGYGSKEEAARIRFQVWNMLPLEEYRDGYCDIPVERRRRIVQIRFADNPIVTPIENRVIHSKEEAWEHYAEVRSRPTPLEGTVVKAPNEIWKDRKSLLMAKLKSCKQAEVIIIGWEKGKAGGKNENRLGSFIVESSCGKLKGKCSGMSDAIRDEDPDTWIGRIITVEFNAVSKHKSFDHARFIEWRQDKSEADDLEYILKVKSVRK